MPHNIRHFEIIKALAKYRHFGDAAVALRISQPSLTRSLKEFEERLGVILFDRKEGRPTEFGEIALGYGKTILNSISELKREIEARKGLDSGVLTITSGTHSTTMSVRRAVTQLARSHPHLAVNWQQHERAQARALVIEGAVDVAVTNLTAIESDDRLLTEPLRVAPMRVFSSSQHPLAAKAKIELEDLMSYPWVGPALPSYMRKALPQDDMPCGYHDPKNDRLIPRVMVSDFESIIQIVLGGSGLSAAFPQQIEKELSTGQCVMLPYFGSWLFSNYGFVIKKHRTPSPAVVVFMDLVRKAESE